MNSISNPKVKTTEEKKVWAHSLARSTLGVEGCVGTPRWGLRRVTNKSITHTDLHKPNNKLVCYWLVHNWSTFNTQMNHLQTQIHKTHHNPNLREATTFPLIVFYVPNHRASSQMSFCPRTPKLEIPKFLKLGLSLLWRPITSFANL
jgi:hypothetical protein